MNGKNDIDSEDMKNPITKKLKNPFIRVNKQHAF